MTIRKKTILILVASITALVAVSSAIFYLTISSRFRKLELQEVHNSVDRVVKELDDTAERLSATAKDWGHWDDTWLYLMGRNPGYIEDNLGTDSLFNLRIEMLIVAGSDGSVKVAREVDLEKRTGGTPDPAFTDALITALAVPTRKFSGSRTGYCMVEGRALIFGGEPVLRNDGSGPQAGYLIFARFLDDDFIGKMSRKLNQKVYIWPYDDPHAQRLLADSTGTVLHGVTVTAPDGVSGKIFGSSLIPDSQGGTLLVAGVELNRSLNRIARETILNGMAALATLGILFTMLVVLLIDRTVLSRLTAMTGALKREKGANVSLGQTASDEIGVLAATVEKSFEDLARSADRIRRSERQKEMALAGADLGFWEYNAQTRNVFLSERFSGMLGYGQNELAPTLEVVELLIHPEDRSAFEAGFRGALAGGEGWETQYRVKRKDGEYAHVYSKGRVVDYDPCGEPLLIYGTHLDISERVVQESAKKRLQEQLATAQKMKAVATLAGGVAHNFNNILAVIIGYTELVMEDIEKNSQAWKNAREVIVATSRASDLVRQLLIFSKDREQMTERVDIRRIVAETFRFMREVIPTSIEMVQTMPETPAIVDCDSFMIRQAFINICTNAMEAFQGEEGRIIISVSYERGEHGERARIIFSDNGEGMDPATLGSAFDPYFTTKDNAEKAGLGLSLVHGAITGCGGTVEIKSEKGVGTTVMVTLPASIGATVVEAAPVGNLEGTERILFIDDEKLLTDIARQYFGRLGYTVEVTDSALDGLKLILADPDAWDVVITDMTMPGLSGAELASRAHQARPDLPVFLCSGYIDVLTEEQRARAGITRIFKKPVSFDELAAAIRSRIVR